jgi:hypothetical protein
MGDTLGRGLGVGVGRKGGNEEVLARQLSHQGYSKEEAVEPLGAELQLQTESSWMSKAILSRYYGALQRCTLIISWNIELSFCLLDRKFDMQAIETPSFLEWSNGRLAEGMAIFRKERSKIDSDRACSVELG